MKRTLKHVGLSACFLLAGIQLWPAGRTNPATSAGLDAPPEVTAILRRACFDCHSNETRWPWYGYVAPVSWLLVHDVDEGRAELNFSEWGSLPEDKRAKRKARVVDEVESAKMPPPGYLRFHGDARLTPEEIAVLEAWAAEPR